MKTANNILKKSAPLFFMLLCFSMLTGCKRFTSPHLKPSPTVEKKA